MYILTLPAHDEPHPPFFMLLLHFWIKIFGISPYSVRIIPLLFHAFTAVIIYFIGKKFFSLWSGILATGIFIFATCHFCYSIETRSYSMLSMATAASLYFFLSLKTNFGNRKYLIALILANFVLIYCHYFGWFVVFIEFLASFMYIDNKKLFKTLFVALICTGLVFLPMALIAIQKLFTFSVKNTGWVFSKTTSYDYLNRLYYFFNNKYVFFIILLMLIGGIVRFYFIKTPKKNISRELIILFLWWFVPFTIMFLLPEKISIFSERYVMFNSIGLYIFTAAAINFLYSQKQAYFLGALLLIVMFSQLDVNSRHSNFAKVQKSINNVKSIVDDNTIILIQGYWFSPQLMYYYDQEIFKNITNYDSLLLKNDIFIVDSVSNVIEKIDKKERIIYTGIWRDKNVIGYLDSHYERTDSIFYEDCFYISVFESVKKLNKKEFGVSETN